MDETLVGVLVRWVGDAREAWMVAARGQTAGALVRVWNRWEALGHVREGQEDEWVRWAVLTVNEALRVRIQAGGENAPGMLPQDISLALDCRLGKWVNRRV